MWSDTHLGKKRRYFQPLIRSQWTISRGAVAAIAVSDLFSMQEIMSDSILTVKCILSH